MKLLLNNFEVRMAIVAMIEEKYNLEISSTDIKFEDCLMGNPTVEINFESD